MVKESVQLGIYIYLSITLQPLWTLAAFFFCFLIYTKSIGLLGGGSASRKAATYTQNKRRQKSMSRVGFESTIPVFERAKTVHALDSAATVIVRNL
jgi:hypothetical protein